MTATPHDRHADPLRKFIDNTEEAHNLTPGFYDEERILLMYRDRYGEWNMTKALRWHELRNMGIPDEDAYAKVQQEFPS